uniref:Uncharacterized protein LOC113794865 n=1 Tax=Dermatophagoides pteronyssinus TaxID=6956 RepID=A0A6P6Y8D8_DERPT|nr:uncharacterized protein LOC113794865 [Dermatophagoides pteronyssinus]
MDCEIEITALCSKEYSKILETNTHETFTKVCANNVGCGYKSSCCSWDKNTRNQFALVCSLLIIAIGLLVLLAGCTIKYFQAKNKLKMLPEPKLKRATSLPTGFTKGVQGKDLVRTGSLPTRLNPNMPTPNIPAITRPQITSPVITKPTIPAISDDDVSTVQRLMIIRFFDNQTYFQRIYYPYKPVYGIPKSLNCDQSVYERFDQCEQSIQQKWEINIPNYFYQTKDFCCFVWDTMDCEIKIAAECSEEYSQKLEANTRETFTAVCKIVGSNHQSWSCKWTKLVERNVIIAVSVISTILVLIGIGLSIYYCVRAHKKSAAAALLDKDKQKQSKKLSKKLSSNKSHKSHHNETPIESDKLSIRSNASGGGGGRDGGSIKSTKSNVSRGSIKSTKSNVSGGSIKSTKANFGGGGSGVGEGGGGGVGGGGGATESTISNVPGPGRGGGSIKSTKSNVSGGSIKSTEANFGGGGSGVGGGEGGGVGGGGGATESTISNVPGPGRGGGSIKSTKSNVSGGSIKSTKANFGGGGSGVGGGEGGGVGGGGGATESTISNVPDPGRGGGATESTISNIPGGGGGGGATESTISNIPDVSRGGGATESTISNIPDVSRGGGSIKSAKSYMSGGGAIVETLDEPLGHSEDVKIITEPLSQKPFPIGDGISSQQTKPTTTTTTTTTTGDQQPYIPKRTVITNEERISKDDFEAAKDFLETKFGEPKSDSQVITDLPDFETRRLNIGETLNRQGMPTPAKKKTYLTKSRTSLAPESLTATGSSGVSTNPLEQTANVIQNTDTINQVMNVFPFEQNF